VGAAFTAAGQWVAAGAVWLLGEVGAAMSATTTVDLSSGWFLAHESVMVAMAGAVVLPMICCTVIQALYRQSASMLVRAFLVQLPLALLLTGVAVQLVQMALAVTDAFSAEILNGAGVDTRNILAPVTDFLLGFGIFSFKIPPFVVFVGGLMVALATLGLWLELAARAAAVSVAVLFLPLALAAMVWPAVSHWCRRLADTLVALILSKLVIASVLALAVSALAGGLGVGSESGPGGGFAAVVTGIALLVIATVAPFTLLRLIPAIESGAVDRLDEARRHLRSGARAPGETGSLALDKVRKAKESLRKGGHGPAGDVGSAMASITQLRGGKDLADYFFENRNAGRRAGGTDHRAVAGQTGPDPSGPDRSGPDPSGPDPSGPAGAGTHRTGTGRARTAGRPTKTVPPAPDNGGGAGSGGR
jgi:hypothetical protein